MLWFWLRGFIYLLCHYANVLSGGEMTSRGAGGGGGGAQLKTPSWTITLHWANINCSILQLSAACDVFVYVPAWWLCCTLMEQTAPRAHVVPMLHPESSHRDVIPYTFTPPPPLLSVFLSILPKHKEGKTNGSRVVIIFCTGVIIRFHFHAFRATHRNSLWFDLRLSGQTILVHVFSGSFMKSPYPTLH